jgi:tricorn protease
MLQKIFLAVAIFSTLSGHTQESTPLLWIQQPAISPDGQWIAFEYKGNLFKVNATGGQAVPLTINTAYNGYPVWSHDGKTIAFASNRYGNFDVFVMASSGGEARRLTTASAKDIPQDFSPDDRQLYFITDRHDPASSVRFPADNVFAKLYAVPVAGGRNTLVNAAGTEYVHFNEAGDKFLFQDRKGGEDPWRKHQRSAAARDIWVCDQAKHTYTRLTNFDGEDREPVWGQGNTFYYLSERNGDQNLFQSSSDQPTQITQLTQFTRDPVRYLSRSASGIFAFTQAGDLYTLKPGQQPQKLTVTCPADIEAHPTLTVPMQDGITEIAVSPNGKELALICHGNIYVVAAGGDGLKQLTSTPYPEKMLSFGPDGRTLLYSVEKDTSWDLYTATIASKDEPYFYAATTIDIRPLIATPADEYQGIFSPDGKNIAYLENRDILKVYNLEKKTSVTVLPAGNNHSIVDGDQYFTWSPDSRYILTPSREGFSDNPNVLLLKADGSGDKVTVTHSGFSVETPQWGIDGKMMYYLSDRSGMRNLSPNGSGQEDVYAVFFDRAAFETYQLSKDELALHAGDTSKKTADRGKTADLDLVDLDSRTLRLTLSPADLAGSKLSPDGEKLYYLAKYDNAYDLWVTSPRTHETKVLAKLNAGNARLAISKDGAALFVLADGHLNKINAENGTITALSFNLTMELDQAAERRYIFEHTYRDIRKKFFDPGLHGTDWNYYHTVYARFLPHVNNNYDFEVLLSEFLGELNNSHTGSRYYSPRTNGDETAALGLLYDEATTTKGLLVKAVLEGGPFDRPESQLRKGYLIDHIDGVAIEEGTDWPNLLNHKAGKFVSVSFHDPNTNKIFQETVKPVSAAAETRELLYKHWIHRMETLTDSLSNGRLLYVHIRYMDEESLRNTLDKVQARNPGKKAIIIDSRFNPGGNIHEELVELLGKKDPITPWLRGNELRREDTPDSLQKPSCVLMDEGNYSDGYNFPKLYKHAGIGKLIGMPVPGTGTGVFWEWQIDGSLLVGYPIIGLTWTGERSFFENQQLEPDIKVADEYPEVLAGKDRQLETAVKEMLQAISNR